MLLYFYQPPIWNKFDLGSFLRGSFHQPTFKNKKAGETGNSQPRWTMVALRGNDKKSIGRLMKRGGKSKLIREAVIYVLAEFGR